MSWRTGHGNGAGGPRIEVMPADELPSASPSNTDRPNHGPDGRFLPGNRSGLSSRLRPGPHGGIDTAAPEFKPFKAWARRYASHRREELARAHGGELSAGASAIVESASLALAAARYCQHKGAETCDVDLLKRAGDFTALARQHELAAWEIASREAVVRRKASSRDPLAAFAAKAAQS